ncbi:MAG TPA: hypothetical protein VFW23_12860 [Tepidisphaeraceae bacterium]|nr:hypothetical protein [Tepidisphaeraceae bacterium]
MPVLCLGTCSNCGAQRSWASYTLSLQLDDGQLVCLRHPGESFACEKYGLTLGQASKRGRLYLEEFYVCRNCGRDGQTIVKKFEVDSELVSVRSVMKWGWGSALLIVPFLLWMRWWEAAFVIGVTLLVSPILVRWENQKAIKENPLLGGPRADAPGRFPIAPPTHGRPETVVGQILKKGRGESEATGPCCDNPDWINAGCTTDKDRIPCDVCNKGVMVTSERGIS